MNTDDSHSMSQSQSAGDGSAGSAGSGGSAGSAVGLCSAWHLLLWGHAIAVPSTTVGQNGREVGNGISTGVQIKESLNGMD